MMNPTIINIGNDRPNIMYKVTSFKEAVSSFKDLLFLKDKAKTIVYFDNRDLAEQAGHLLRTWFGQEQVRVYHGFKTDDLKNRRMKEFREGKYPILLATEAAGMGCDIRDIARVVQYGYPRDINCLFQRFGRAARDGTIQGYGIFLVPKSAPKVTPKKKDPVQQDLKDLIDLANSPGCIRKYFNDYYGNEHVPVTDVCCNICNPDEADDKDESSTIQPADKASKREKWDKNEAEQVRNALIVWRDNMYDLHFKGRMHDTEQTVMTDYMLNKTVKKYKSIIAARSIDMLYWDPLNETYPSQVLEIIMGLGKQFLEEKDEKEKKNRQEKERRRQFGMAPSFQIPPLISATTDQQEMQVVSTASRDQQQSDQLISEDEMEIHSLQDGYGQRQIDQNLPPQQVKESKNLTQLLLKPPKTPPKKTKAIRKKGGTATENNPSSKQKELKVIQYFLPPSPQRSNQVQDNTSTPPTISIIQHFGPSALKR
ncbi:hypothetical protein EMPS_07649 [Entomortierella parvispora]|uniref:DNA 3'-5' helicase n=1 Tax=Entomortierella parvispora TaxID=205924 RepID=A0A9P3HEI8_9FUNG|nr:hypothetical protein EMPS_07649 [Entomortierella parvispora]